MSLWSPRAVATHEAGHVLVAAVNDIPIIEARVWRPAGCATRGYVHVDMNGRGVNDESRVGMYLAGGEANRIGGFADREVAMTAQSDRKLAAGVLGVDEGDGVYRWWETRTRDLLAMWPEMVDQLADDLLRRGVLTGAEVASITGIKPGWSTPRAVR